MSCKPNVYVVEDDAGMREAVTQLLLSANFTVRSYPSAEKFLIEVDHSLPICLLTDVRLPGMDGIALFRHLVRLGMEPAVVVITGHGDIPMAVAALKEGVVDFIEKPFNPDVLLESVSDAWRRAQAREERNAVAAGMEARQAILTQRELEVLDLLTEGHLNKVVAAKLGMSIRTAEHHRARIMEKMKARSLSELIKMQLGIGR
jgi:two-component system, LuxR family, response regulator FixJ